MKISTLLPDKITLKENRNTFLLALCQALAATGKSILFTIVAVVSYSITNDKSLSIFPLALVYLANMVATFPASFLIKRCQKQGGFIIGAVIGLLGAMLGVLAVGYHSFIFFCLATILLGVFFAFAGFYRFAAADAASEVFRSKAVSWVMAGGIVAAVSGPLLATESKNLFQSAPFAGSLAVIIGLQLITLVVLQFIDVSQPAKVEHNRMGRPLIEIVRQPIFIVAVMGSTIGYSVMIVLMAVTPLAMVAHSHSFENAAFVIQTHMFGMFALSFVTGHLINLFGVLNIILSGVILNGLCIVFNLIGTGFWHFWIALFLLGIGWNFMFIGSTVLLSTRYSPNEKPKARATHDFLMYGFITISVFSSGKLFDNFNWQGLNYASIPLLLLMLAAIVWLHCNQKSLKTTI